MSERRRMRLLAIDIGERRFGLAVCDSLGMIASPAGFVERRRGKKIPVASLIAKAEALEAEGFVVGLPLDGEGSETPRSADARWLAAELTRRTGKPAQLVDERYTTAKARRAIQEMGGSIEGRRGDVDALAATVLLQHALGLPQ
jgi:putative Holliday junction resolvase